MAAREDAVGLWPVQRDGVAAWRPVASGQARVLLAGSGRPGAQPLAIDYDFGTGGGFVVARAEVALQLPEVWEMRLRIRGRAPSNGIEIKVVDEAGTSAWRWKRDAFEAPDAWTDLVLPGHAFEFAWGPVGGAAPARIGAVEIVVVANPGGRGLLEAADLRILDCGRVEFASTRASSCATGTAASMAVDGDAGTAWQPAADAAWLELVLAEPRDLGGLVLSWSVAPRALRLLTADAAGTWSERHRMDGDLGPRSFVALAVDAVHALRIEVHGKDAALAEVLVRPPGWARTPSDFACGVAALSPRGDFPRYCSREQVLWTPVASPASGPVGLLGADGAVEVGEAGFTLEPSLFVEGVDGAKASEGSSGRGRWLGWADAEASFAQEESPLPVASVRLAFGTLELRVTAVAEDAGSVLVRYRVRNASSSGVRGTLFVSVRPFQVTPPWQAWRNLGGPSPLHAVEVQQGRLHLRAGGEPAAVACWPQPAAAGATCFDAGGAALHLREGLVPAQQRVEDPAGRAEGVLAFPLALAAGEEAEVYACSVRAGDGATRMADARGGERRMASVLEAWREALPLRAAVRAPAFDVAATAVGHVLACRSGAALQPGPRRYTRSWIRDGAVMAAALARAGRVDAATAFARWYAPHQRDDGFVPCCVDRDGADPLVEHDSHGQLVHAVAEAYRFSRDRSFAEQMWARCERAAGYLDALRALRRTSEFAAGARRACLGLVPESVSHEGYLAQPVHAYWDDLWAWRGYRDAAFLASELGKQAEARRWEAAAAELAADLGASVRVVMDQHGLDTVPASVEWADFDPTAIAGAVSLLGAAALLPDEALQRTFDRFVEGLRRRLDPAQPWTNYSPYEVRVVGALARMGRRDDANLLLDALLADRRPVAWNQWPEILWRDAKSPAHLGDLPHCWIGAEFWIALRTLLAYEREEDGVLVLGAGMRREWLDAGVEACGLPTWWGPLDLSVRLDGDRYRVRASGGAAPPGGFAWQLPRPFVQE